MLEAFAIVAESDDALRNERSAALRAVGYSVRECATPDQLKLSLLLTAAFTSNCLLLVAPLDMAAPCGKAISKVGKARLLSGSSRPLVVLMSNSDSLNQAVPDLDGCEMVLILRNLPDHQQFVRLAADHSLLVGRA